MGYYVETTASNITIPYEAFVPICKHLLDEGIMTNYKEMSGGDMKGDKWYSWVTMSELENSLKANNLIEVFTMFGYEVGTDCLEKNPTITDLSYNQKSGNEIVLLRMIAPFIENDSYIDWKGEGGELYRWEFFEQELIEREGVITWV